MRTYRLPVFACSLLLLPFVLGCSDRLRTYPVQGKVQFVEGGGPVHVGTIELKSLEHEGIHARGEIQNDGSFELSTYEPGDGAIAGKHGCVVVQMVMTEELSGHRGSKIGVVHPRHNSYATSGLEVVIAPGKTNEIVLEVDGILKKQPEEHGH